MREILFRGKTESGKWVEGSLILAKNFCCILQDEEKVHPLDFPYLDGDMGIIDGSVTPVIPETIGQYIGLTDKNGKKVFEWDIVKQGRYIRTVAWEMSCGSCCSQVIGFAASGEMHTDFVRLDEDFEIIGNIHDNPELVKGGADNGK